MPHRAPILTLDQLPEWREARRREGIKVVATNGCFDLLHLGHVTYLEQARALGDLLVVGLNADSSVRALKGSGRPLNPEGDRAAVLTALRAVDAVCVFPEPRAVRFLQAVQPDVYVKGGDYTLDRLDPEESAAVTRAGGRIVLLPLVPGRSTTATLARMGSLPS